MRYVIGFESHAVARGMLVTAAVWIVFAIGRLPAVEGQNAPPQYTQGQQVEVQEGDTWWAAAIVKKEGRKYLIHRAGADASTDEWVTMDRIRLPGAAGAPGAAWQKFYANGTSVEVKSGPRWKSAKVVNHRGDWVLVDIDNNQFKRQWVEPWRVRDIGASYDFIGWAKDNPRVRHNEDPPSEKPGPAPQQVPGTSTDSPRGQGNGAGNEQALKPASLDNLPALTSLPPDAGVPLKAFAGPIPLSGKSGATLALVISRGAGMAAVLQQAAGQFSVDRVDLVAGKVLNIAQLPSALDLLDLSLDGKLLVTRSASNQNRQTQVDVWQIEGAQAVSVASFVPFSGNADSAKVEWARFIDGKRLLVCGRNLAAFDFQQGKQVWAYKLGIGAPRCDLSAGRKFLAVPTGLAIAVIDAFSGKALGQIEWLAEYGKTVAFSSDGTQIAAANVDMIKIWDLPAVKLAHEISIVPGGPAWRLDWGLNGYLLVDRTHLASVAEQAIVWSYSELPASSTSVLNGRLYYLSGSVPNSETVPRLLSVALPEQQVRDTLAVVGRPRLVFKPGMSVALEVHVDASKQQQVVDRLTAQLKDNGITVAENQPIKLVAKDEPGPDYQAKYNSFGVRRPPETFSVHQVNFSVQIVDADGKALWARSTRWNPPIALELEAGQSAQQMVADDLKMAEQFYDSIYLPKSIARNPAGFGTTRLDVPGAHP